MRRVACCLLHIHGFLYETPPVIDRDRSYGVMCVGVGCYTNNSGTRAGRYRSYLAQTHREARRRRSLFQQRAISQEEMEEALQADAG